MIIIKTTKYAVQFASHGPLHSCWYTSREFTDMEKAFEYMKERKEFSKKLKRDHSYTYRIIEITTLKDEAAPDEEDYTRESIEDQIQHQE